MDEAARSVRRCDAAEAGAAGLTELSTRTESQTALSPLARTDVSAARVAANAARRIQRRFKRLHPCIAVDVMYLAEHRDKPMIQGALVESYSDYDHVMRQETASRHEALG